MEIYKLFCVLCLLARGVWSIPWVRSKNGIFCGLDRLGQGPKFCIFSSLSLPKANGVSVKGSIIRFATLLEILG